MKYKAHIWVKLDYDIEIEAESEKAAEQKFIDMYDSISYDSMDYVDGDYEIIRIKDA